MATKNAKNTGQAAKKEWIGNNPIPIPSLRSARRSLRSLCALWPTSEFGFSGPTPRPSFPSWLRLLHLFARLSPVRTPWTRINIVLGVGLEPSCVARNGLRAHLRSNCGTQSALIVENLGGVNLPPIVALRRVTLERARRRCSGGRVVVPQLSQRRVAVTGWAWSGGYSGRCHAKRWHHPGRRV